MSTELAPHHIVEWLRAKSKELAKAADQLEATFQSLAQMNFAQPTTVPKGIQSPTRVIRDRPPLTVEDLTEHLKTNGGRIHHIAARLAVSEDQIMDLIEKSDGQIYVADRGWVKLKPIDDADLL